MNRMLWTVLAVGMGCGDDTPKDTGEANPCFAFVDSWTACVIAAGEPVDASLEDPAAYCADNADETPETWRCLDDAILDQYCTNITGLTHLQAAFGECHGY